MAAGARSETKRKAKAKPKEKEKSQRERFIETARKLGVDETGKKFEEAVSVILPRSKR